MKAYQPERLAAEAVASPGRPGTVIVHDGVDARLVVFRIGAGEAVAVHTSPSSVILTVLSGSGLVSDGQREHPVGPGDVLVYEPREPHGMRATSGELVVLATIAPRPGSR